MTKYKLLIVWVYYPAVGHVIEALEVAANYYSENKNLEIHILLNNDSPHVLGEYCDFIHRVHFVDVSVSSQEVFFDSDLGKLTFDYVVFPKRFKYNRKDFTEKLLAINDLLYHLLNPKICKGFNDDNNSELSSLLIEKKYSRFSINIPKESVDFKFCHNHKYPLFSVLLKGASKSTVWPSFDHWFKILTHIKYKYPDCVFYITGITDNPSSIESHRLMTYGKLNDFINSIPDAINCYDVGFVNQMAIIANSDIFIAPHSGFSFLAPCLGTPWLALSGGEWAEHMTARMPFYSVLPECSCYPCSDGDMKSSCRFRIAIKRPIKCMENLIDRKDDVLYGIEKLLNKQFGFKESFIEYKKSAELCKVNINKIWRIREFDDYLNTCTINFLDNESNT
jgi:hypothetical protein